MCGRVLSPYVSLWISFFVFLPMPLSFSNSPLVFVICSLYPSLSPSVSYLPHTVSQPFTSFPSIRSNTDRFVNRGLGGHGRFLSFIFPVLPFPWTSFWLPHPSLPMLLHSLTYCICTLTGAWAIHANTCTHHHSKPLQWRIEICLGHVVQSIVHSHADGTHSLQLYQTEWVLC